MFTMTSELPEPPSSGEVEEGVTKRQQDYLARTLRVIKLGLGKLWRRQSATITEYDPSYKVFYLGNVLTGWAKGEGCTEKPVGTLWRNYCASSRADVAMTVTVSAGGLRAVTREHGLTEYWSHRITYCTAPQAFPRVFCWVYRHEGRRLKQELRCHAVLCSKENVARTMASQLQQRLSAALSEFRRDKLSRQNARLSLANSVYDNPSMPRRRILLSTGAHNYRPPLERCKSAPKLGAIDESIEEESILEEEEEEEEDLRLAEGGSISSESGVVITTPRPGASTEDKGLTSMMESSFRLQPEPNDCEDAESDESGYADEASASRSKSCLGTSSWKNVVAPESLEVDSGEETGDGASQRAPVPEKLRDTASSKHVQKDFFPLAEVSQRSVSPENELGATCVTLASQSAYNDGAFSLISTCDKGASDARDPRLHLIKGATTDSSYVEV